MNYFASYGATRFAFARSSNPDVTTSEGLTKTNVNMLPSGTMNRSNFSPAPGKVAVPVQSALKIFVPEVCPLRMTCPLALPETTESILPLPS